MPIVNGTFNQSKCLTVKSGPQAKDPEVFPSGSGLRALEESPCACREDRVHSVCPIRTGPMGPTPGRSLAAAFEEGGEVGGDAEEGVFVLALAEMDEVEAGVGDEG